MSQGQTFNLIHKCYHYIISSFLSNIKLLRCKENALYICTLEPSIKSIILHMHVNNQRLTIQRHWQHWAHNTPDEDKQNN